ncbi:MAG: beta-galactosidase, partial [Huintestinicola sp.]
TLLVNALDENGAVIASDVQKSFGDPVSVRIVADRKEIVSDGNDLCFLDISVTDKNGTPVANARNRIKLEVSGSGRLLGMDNGDSTDYEQYKTDSRKLFSGRLTAIISSDGTEGDIICKASSCGLETAEVVIKSAGVSDNYHGLIEQISPSQPSDDIPVRKIEAETNGVISLDENNTTVFVRCHMLPENATYNDVTLKIVKPNSVETNMAEAEYSDGMLKITAKGDGDCLVRLYANNGAEYPQVISDIAVNITGLGDTTKNPYSMISGCTYSVSSVPLNIISDGALGSFTEPCSFGYTSVDFGKAGTENIRIYIGNCCNREIPITIYDGAPEKNGRAIMTIMFPHNNGWGSFEPMEFALPECLKGVHDIYFSLKDNCIFGGFEFIPIEKAYALLFAADNDSIYGDEFTVNGNCVENIGNNVILAFSEMDFADGTVKLEVTGRTPNAVNTIQLRYTENGEAKTQLLEFEFAENYTTRAFDISKISGKTDISFMFMPGSKFDFESFRFIK